MLWLLNGLWAWLGPRPLRSTTVRGPSPGPVHSWCQAPVGSNVAPRDTLCLGFRPHQTERRRPHVSVVRGEKAKCPPTAGFADLFSQQVEFLP